MTSGSNGTKARTRGRNFVVRVSEVVCKADRSYVLWPRQRDNRGSVPGLDGHSRVSHCVHSGPGAALHLSKLPVDPSIGKAFGLCNQPLTCS
jgi:hypothetical protein